MWQCQRGLADWGPEKVQHAGGEKDKYPGVDDRVNRDEAEGNKVQAVRLGFPKGVNVDSDLRKKWRRGWEKGGELAVIQSGSHILADILI